MRTHPNQGSVLPQESLQNSRYKDSTELFRTHCTCIHEHVLVGRLAIKTSIHI